MKKRHDSGRAMALELAARIIAATLGGYVFCYAATAAASRVLPMARSETVILTAFAGILVMVAIAIWAFGCRSIARTWAILAGATLPLYAIGFWFVS